MTQHPNPNGGPDEGQNPQQYGGQPGAYGTQSLQQPGAYGQTGHGAPQQPPHGQQSQQSAPQYGQQPYGQTAPKRSGGMTALGVIFAVVAAFFALSAISAIGGGTMQSNNGAETFGMLIGALLMVGVPLLLSYLCLTSHTRKAKRQAR